MVSLGCEWIYKPTKNTYVILACGYLYDEIHL